MKEAVILVGMKNQKYFSNLYYKDNMKMGSNPVYMNSQECVASLECAAIYLGMEFSIFVTKIFQLFHEAFDLFCETFCVYYMTLYKKIAK